MGFTSRAKMVQMGVHDMIWGRLTDAMAEEDGASVSLERFVHPRVEPELAFLLAKPLSANASLPEALDAVAAIAPALEIIDSRFDNFKFTLEDVVADNASSSGYVIGPWCNAHQGFANLGLVMSIDGSARQVGSTAGILGNPLRSLAAAARLSAAAGEPLQAAVDRHGRRRDGRRAPQTRPTRPAGNAEARSGRVQHNPMRNQCH